MSSSQAPRRALVLSAGRGERLRPLTEFLPKPLLPVLGRAIVERTLERLAASGVEAAAVNLHHLGEAIREHLGSEVGGMPLTFSVERRLLGTLGPFGRLQEFFAGVDPVLLVNGDSLCEWPIEEVAAAHRRSGADATLLLTSTADPDAFGGGVVTDLDGTVLSFRGDTGAAGRGVFAGLHIISGRLLEGVEAHPSDIVRQLYEPLLERGAIHAVFTDRRWHDMGTPERYLVGVLEEAHASAQGAEGSWVSPAAQVDPSANVVRSVIEDSARVGADATVERSLLLRGARVAAGTMVVDSIVGPGVEVEAGARVVGELVTGGSAPTRTPIAGVPRR